MATERVETEVRTPSEPPASASEPATVAIVAARNEADRIGATLDALKRALPGVRLVVANDASEDSTATVAMAHGAEVITRRRRHGKGANVTAAAESVVHLADAADPPVFLLCDGDLGECAGELSRLVEAVAAGECDLAVASFSRRVGGGFGVALGFARWAIRRRCGVEVQAPISGQRALSASAFREVLPLADGFGLEMGMTIDAVRAGYGLSEYELDLEHRATGRTLSGFLHRGRQLWHFLAVYLRRRPR